MIDIVVEGQPRARIVVSEIDLPVEQHAVTELNKYIRQMSGVELPVATTPGDNTTNIYIGRAASTEDIDMSEETLGFDGYIVKTIEKDKGNQCSGIRMRTGAPQGGASGLRPPSGLSKPLRT